MVNVRIPEADWNQIVSDIENMVGLSRSEIEVFECAEVTVEKVVKPDNEIAVEYFNTVILPTLGPLPSDGTRYLQDQYVHTALKNGLALLELRKWYGVDDLGCFVCGSKTQGHNESHKCLTGCGEKTNGSSFCRDCAEIQ